MTLPVTAAQAATRCSVDYTTSDWPGGFTATVTIRNLGGSPISGAWFPAQFQELMKNAYPPLS